MNTITIIASRNHEPNTYGGYIYAEDFCTDYNGSRNMAQRIIDDWNFDIRCKKAMANTKRKAVYA